MLMLSDFPQSDREDLAMFKEAVVILIASTDPIQLLTVDQFTAMSKYEQDAFLDGYFQSQMFPEDEGCKGEWFYRAGGRQKIDAILAATKALEKNGKDPQGLYGDRPMVEFLLFRSAAACLAIGKKQGGQP
jgi:hypothetical protein